MSGHGRATEVLRQEHRLILQVATALEQMLPPAGVTARRQVPVSQDVPMQRPTAAAGAVAGEPETGSAVLPLEDVRRCITFFRLFADACHHGKEEDLLFAALEEHDAEGTAGAISLMREEHRYGRALVAQMDHAADRMAGGDGSAGRTLVAAAAAYIDFIRDHIRKEDDGLFDVADDVLHGGACARLCDAYESACRQRFGGHTLEELETLAEGLIDRPAR
jgi:hemerythrin-like domain-containing protein